MSEKTKKQADQKEEAKNGFYFPENSSSFEECEIIKITDDGEAFAFYMGPKLYFQSCPPKVYVTGTLGKDVFLNKQAAILEQNNRKISHLEIRIYSLEHRPWWKFWG